MTRRKPTRRDLLVVIGRLQDAIGMAKGVNQNDRDPDGCAKIDKSLGTAFDLCVEALGQDPPIQEMGPWAK